ncbi:hypothetical protein LELE5274_13515 [Lederbergia lenta]
MTIVTTIIGGYNIQILEFTFARFTNQSPILPETYTVNLAVTWEESIYPYQGRFCEGFVGVGITNLGNLYGDIKMNRKKSADVIVRAWQHVHRVG